MLKKQKPIQLLLLSTLTFALGACAYGPKSNKKESALSRLNGERYERPEDEVKTYLPSPIPFVKRVPQSTEVSGTVFFKSSPFDFPANRVNVELLYKGKKVTSRMTDNKGRFAIIHKLADGTYTLKATKKEKSIKKQIKVEGHKLENVSLFFE